MHQIKVPITAPPPPIPRPEPVRLGSDIDRLLIKLGIQA